MTKSAKKVLIICLVAIVALGALVYLTNGFQNTDKDYISGQLRPVNPDNLYTAECCALEDQNDGNGVAIDVKSNGVIVLNGTATADGTYTIGTVALKAGTYTFTACDQSSNSTVLVTAYNSATKVATADLTASAPGGRKFTLASDATITLKIEIKDDAEFNHLKIMPVIVSGDEPAEFYK